jgi:hydroxymethylglutaryl-CoA lyase
LADTIGVGVPADVRRLVAAVRDVSDAPLRFHLHNTRNTGYANAVAAVEQGAVALDASSGGIGGCPFAPNATGTSLPRISRTCSPVRASTLGWCCLDLLVPSALIAEQLGAPGPGLLARAGDFPGQRG